MCDGDNGWSEDNNWAKDNNWTKELEEKYVILKVADINKYLSTDLKYRLTLVLNAISNGRTKDNKEPLPNYMVCNTDEAYAKEIWDIIKHGEAAKYR